MPFSSALALYVKWAKKTKQSLELIKKVTKYAIQKKELHKTINYLKDF
jgi:hypothetical protein